MVEKTVTLYYHENTWSRAACPGQPLCEKRNLDLQMSVAQTLVSLQDKVEEIFIFFQLYKKLKLTQYGVKLINKVLKYPRAHILGCGYSRRTPWNRKWWINFAPEDSTVCFHDIKRQCNFFHRKDRTDVSFQIIEFLCLRLICTEF